MRELIDGATAIVRGALRAGCDFFAGYPITPATPILIQMMRQLPRAGGVAVQGEDEISSIGMCIGAAMAGRSPLTATSGPGLSLYSENLGLALMVEVPLVIVDVQRLGPATGGATAVGQGDVQFARWGTGGGFPLIVLAPSSVRECLTLTVEAFTLARRFRCPVILLTDKELNLTQATVEDADVSAPVGAPTGAPDPLVPVPPPFGAGEVVRRTGSAHDAQGMITKDPEAIAALNRGLVEKITAHREELARVVLDPPAPPADAEVLLVAFGTAARAMRAALRTLRRRGHRVTGVVVQSLWPVPDSALRLASQGVQRVVVGELNPGLYVREVRRLFPDREVVSVGRYDGRMLAPEAFIAAVEGGV